MHTSSFLLFLDGGPGRLADAIKVLLQREEFALGAVIEVAALAVSNLAECEFDFAPVTTIMPADSEESMNRNR
jgi:hypothetical protein